MAGSVKVTAWSGEDKTSPALVMASQRVIWNGFFNEVTGQVLDPPLPADIPETTRVLGSETSALLTSVSEAGATSFLAASPTPSSQLVFTGTAQQLAPLTNLSPGDIIVIDPCSAAPYGLLRKVEGIETSVTGQVTLTTSQATLEEALIQGSIRLDTDELTAEAASSQQPGGAMQTSTVGLGTYTISLNKTLYDEGGVQVNAAGSISISPSFDFEADVGWRGIKRVKFVDNTTETSNLSVTATGSVGFDKQWEVWSQTLPSIKFAIGPVPVWITPVVHVYVGANGEVYAQVTTGVTQEAHFTAGLEYDNGNWRTISGFSNSFSFQPPTLSAGANFKAYARPQLDLMIYSVTGPYVFVDGYLRLDAQAYPCYLDWKLYGGLDAGAGFKIEILGHGVSYDKGFNIVEKQIAPQTGSGLTRLTNNDSSDAVPAWSPDGCKIVFTSNRDGNDEIYVMNSDGSDQKRLTFDELVDTSPEWSPDGKKIAFVRLSSDSVTSGIYIMNSDGTNVTRISPEPARHGAPAWSPDGSKIAYESWGGLYVMNIDGTGVMQLTYSGYFSDLSPTWSPDGSKIAFYHTGGVGVGGIVVVNSDGSNRHQIHYGNAHEGHPSWSPDGSRIVFHVGGAGGNSLAAIDTDGSNFTLLPAVSAPYNRDPSWAPEGSRIAFEAYCDIHQAGSCSVVGPTSEIFIEKI